MFFCFKKNECILAYIEEKSIIFFDINNINEVKKLNNAHGNYIDMIRYYEYSLYDIILSSSYNNDIKIWNYNEDLNILTISKIFNNSSEVYSAALLFEKNSFYIFCVGEIDYIKIYDSSGNFHKNIGNNDERRRYIEIIEINENKYIISRGNKGINVFNYPSFTKYFCFIEGNDCKYHNYAKIIKTNNIYSLIEVGDFNKIKIWDFFNKSLIRCISSNSDRMLYEFIVINKKYIIIGLGDNNIKEFDIDNGILIKDINKHNSTVKGIKGIKDKDKNQFFVSYGKDKNIYLWSLNKQ